MYINATSLSLGPLLFFLYINDLQHELKVEGDDNPRKDKADKLQHFFYADDLQIYLRVSIDQLESGVAALTRVTNRVYEWAGSAALKLNASKTKAIICGKSQPRTLQLKFLSPFYYSRIEQTACLRPSPLSP